MSEQAEFDYVIVGAGSAGCILASRLSEDPDTSVLILEAGGPDSDPWIKIPLGWAKMRKEEKHDWGYYAEPEPSIDNRALECARGKVLGGCWSINAMAYVRGHRGDYDRWAGNSMPQWDYRHLLPYFKRSENFVDGADDYRGDSGPIRVSRGQYDDPVVEAYREAVLGLGHPWTDDFNGAQNEGLARSQQTVRDGHRESGATAYLRPALKRRNVTLEMHAYATGIEFEGNRAVGISYLRHGTQHVVRASREVILAGGVINSPHLLMLSGVGAAAELRAQDIDVRVDLPGVGKNLQDHISAGVAFRRTDVSPFLEQMRMDRLAMDIPRAYLFGTGPASQYPMGYVGFLKSEPAEPIPDLQFLFAAGPTEAYPWFPGIRKPFANVFACRAVVIHPKSRGHLELASSDPHKKMRIHQNFFADEEDLILLRKGVRMVREFLSQPALAPYRGPELSPGAEVTDDAEIDAHIRRTCITVHHPMGTCRMGGDSDSVVDPELRVRGTEGLRVVDASVMPDLIGGNINAGVIVIAEKASDIIRGREALPPATV